MRLISALFTLIAISLTSCGRYSVQSDFLSQDRLQGYETYRMIDDNFDKGVNSIMQLRIYDLIKDGMTDAGITQSSDANLGVSYHVIVKEVEDYNTYYNTYYGMWNTYSIPETTINRYTQGTLIMNLVDIAKNEVIWVGNTRGVVSGSTNDNIETLEIAIDDLIMKYISDRDGK